MIDGIARTAPIVILLAEDNDSDARLTEEAMKESRFNHSLYRVKDGVDTMAFLHREAPYQDAPRPNLILLDLNMPKKGGLEVLEELKNNKSLAGIPVVVLTTSNAEADIVKSYKLKASCYVRKPVDFERFIDVVKDIEHFWLKVARLPSDYSRV